jgi:Xaa-Pro dipeptidase
VHCVDDAAVALRGELGVGPLLTLRGLNSDSGATVAPGRFAGDDAWPAARDDALLFPALVEARVFKSAGELALLRHASDVSSAAHLAVMRHAAPGMHEYQLESLFKHVCHYAGGARFLSYTCICASGPNGAILHYGHAGEPNGRALAAGDLCLFDMGCEYACYGADITCTFPASGRFTADQALVYRAVLAAVDAVEAAMAPGVSWVDMHTLSYRALLAGLAAPGGPLRAGADVEAMMAANLGATFMPHGLGHFLGIDTHDVGGYPVGHPPRDERDGYKKLRTARVLEEGMYITVEPVRFRRRLHTRRTRAAAAAAHLLPLRRPLAPLPPGLLLWRLPAGHCAGRPRARMLYRHRGAQALPRHGRRAHRRRRPRHRRRLRRLYARAAHRGRD